MAGVQYGAYGNKSARSARFRRRGAEQYEMSPRPSSRAELAYEMASKGRSASTSGSYKSRPGATPARQDVREARPGDTMGQGLTAPAVWDSFFHGGDKAASLDGLSPQSAHDDVSGYTPSLVGNDLQSPDASYLDTIEPSAANTDSYVSAARQSQDKYFSDRGTPIRRPQVDTASMTVPPLPSPQSFDSFDSFVGTSPSSMGFDTPDYSLPDEL